MSDSLQPHGLQSSLSFIISRSLLRLMLLSQWWHPTISSSVAPFSSCLQSFPASASFLMSWFFELGGQVIGASASGSVLLTNIQGWLPLGVTSLISLLFKGHSSTTISNIKKAVIASVSPALLPFSPTRLYPVAVGDIHLPIHLAPHPTNLTCGPISPISPFRPGYPGRPLEEER